jgi:MFS transporter, ACS family, tartrate transporter
LGSGFLYAFYLVFWSMPTMMLSESAAVATFGLINSIGHPGGFAGPYMIGVLNVRTHSLTASFGCIGVLYVASGSVIVNLKIRDPLATSRGLNPLEK